MNKHDIIKGILKEGVSYTFKNRSICFLPGECQPSRTAGDSLLGNIQDALKHWGWLYSGLTRIFRPVWASKRMQGVLQGLLNRHGPGSIVLNLGSGPKTVKQRPDIINVDLYAFNEVDIIADVTDLPLRDGSADFILNQAMLEHVTHPEDVVREMNRILRPGGELFCYLPFIVPFHAAPHDYFRWTESGLRVLFSQFGQIEIGIGAGPTSGMLWVLQEWLAITFSFGSQKLHDILFLALMVLFAPIKILDVFLTRHPCAAKIASGFYITARK